MQNRVILQKFAKISKKMSNSFFYRENASPGSLGVPVCSTRLHWRRVPEEGNVHCTGFIAPDLILPFSELSAKKITFFCHVILYIQVEKSSKVMKH
jgi:hypothetical protein